MKTAEERLQSLAEHWFLLEPFWFAIFCTHKLTRNDTLSIPFQTGKMRIEYSALQIDNLSDRELEDYLKAEVVRIVLKHPYERIPYEVNRVALGFASDVTVSQAISLDIPLLQYKDLGLPKNLSYEEYCLLLKDRPITQENYASSGSEDDEELTEQQKAMQKTALWQEDEIAQEEINGVIEKAKQADSWGTISGILKELIEASLVVKMDYKKILSSFRASVLSQKRELTRTRPNRRYEFAFMGSRYAFTTRLLVAVDVSGSVSNESLVQFFSIINRFFKYGIKSIDVIQFDCEITGDVLSLKKAKKSIHIQGRGGTSFQPPIDYYVAHPEYDGLIMFTDGQAPCPAIAFRRRILWILTSESDYESAKTWIRTLPNNRAVWIPELNGSNKKIGKSFTL